jgi:CRP-like cAMP-binding protein
MFGRKGAPESRLDLLRHVRLFEGLSDRMLARIDSMTVETTLSPGHELTRQGQPSDQAFVIVEGSAEVRVDGDVVGEAVPGELVGELGVLDHTARRATVTATTPMRVLVLNPGELHSLISRSETAARVQADVDRHRGGGEQA